jgi:hypothetical protein
MAIMGLPTEAPAPLPLARSDISWAGALALAFVIMYTVPLVLGGGYVFYASIHPVSVPMGYGTPLINFPWVAAALLILAALVVGPAALLIAGLIHLLQTGSRKWRRVLAWVGAVAAGTAAGYVIWHGYHLLLNSYPIDQDGSALGPSRWVPGALYWPALIATVGQCAVGVIMTALIAAAAQREPRREPPERTSSLIPGLPWTTPGDAAEATD